MVLKKNRTPACGGESRMKNKQKRHTTSPAPTSTRHLLSHQNNNNKQQPAFLPFNLPMECVSKARWGWWLQFRACVCVRDCVPLFMFMFIHSFIHSIVQSSNTVNQQPTQFPSHLCNRPTPSLLAFNNLFFDWCVCVCVYENAGLKPNSSLEPASGAARMALVVPRPQQLARTTKHCIISTATTIP